MKTALTFFALLFFLKASAYAKIVMIGDRVYLRNEGKQVPIFLVNELIDKEKVEKVNLYDEGRLHIISFAVDGDSEKLYSVDEQGYVYAIDPYSGYRVDRVTSQGEFQFKELPGRKFRVTSKGFFIH